MSNTLMERQIVEELHKADQVATACASVAVEQVLANIDVKRRAELLSGKWALIRTNDHDPASPPKHADYPSRPNQLSFSDPFTADARREPISNSHRGRVAAAKRATQLRRM